jgi:hypothetical protein
MYYVLLGLRNDNQAPHVFLHAVEKMMPEAVDSSSLNMSRGITTVPHTGLYDCITLNNYIEHHNLCIHWSSTNSPGESALRCSPQQQCLLSPIEFQASSFDSYLTTDMFLVSPDISIPPK